MICLSDMSLKKKRVLTVAENSEASHPRKKFKQSQYYTAMDIKDKHTHFPTTKKFDPRNTSKKREQNIFSQTQNIPLAEKMRPKSLSSYVGQKSVVGPNSLLLNLFRTGQIPSMILWGPPGCGKTTLANIIINSCKETMGKKVSVKRLSAVTSGIAAIREAVKEANKESKLHRQVIVVMDEIHRFNKLQQDIFLPHIEGGTLTLIGATTENPSYSLNSALLSRCRVFNLTKLSKHEITEILHSAIRYTNGTICSNEGDIEQCTTYTSDAKYNIDTKTIRWLAEVCDGDARVALGGLELAIQTKVSNNINIISPAKPIIMLSDIKEGLKHVHMLSDRESNQSQHIYSALHKSIASGKVNAALYWLARIMALKEDPVNIARRLVRIASEDVGLADPDALGVAVHTMHGCQMIGMPECDVILGQCVVYLSKAPKSRLVYHAFKAAQKLITEHIGPQPSVPLHIRDRSGKTKLQASLGSSRKYLVRKENVSKSCLPSGLELTTFFDNDDLV